MDGARGSCDIKEFDVNGVDNSITIVSFFHFPGVRVFRVNIFIERNRSVLCVQYTEMEMAAKNSSTVS